MGRSEVAMKKFTGGCNCSQSILSAYCDLYGIDEVTGFKLAEGFGLGMGGLKDECGAITGAFMVLGLANSDGQMGKSETKLDTYDKVKAAAKNFEAHFGTMMCAELLRQEKGLKENATPKQLEESNGKNLICMACVKWTAQYLDQVLEL